MAGDAREVEQGRALRERRPNGLGGGLGPWRFGRWRATTAPPERTAKPQREGPGAKAKPKAKPPT